MRDTELNHSGGPGLRAVDVWNVLSAACTAANSMGKMIIDDDVFYRSQFALIWANIDSEIQAILDFVDRNKLGELLESSYFDRAIASGVADTFGNWGENIADVGADRFLSHIVVHVPVGLGAGEIYEVEIGEGAGGSEVAITRCFGVGYAAAHTTIHPLNIDLTNYARLSTRVKDSEAANNTFRTVTVIA